jgi:hypothetical protein
MLCFKFEGGVGVGWDGKSKVVWWEWLFVMREICSLKMSVNWIM